MQIKYLLTCSCFMSLVQNSLLFVSAFIFYVVLTTNPVYSMNNVASESKNCIDCHQQAVSDWKISDHAKAMAIPTDNTVLGDFNQITVKHYSQVAKFYKENSGYWVELTELNKQQQPTKSKYKIEYTFGHFPLQQYLTKFDNGKYQVLPFSWDSRKKQQGGQKWFANYVEEDLQFNDRLHWTQPLQNWNGMCADCHSDGLKRNHVVSDNSFDTQFDKINVGCQSCHGKMVEHSKQHGTKSSLNEHKTNLNIGAWLFCEGNPTANWIGSERDNSFMDNCFACHSLRSPLTDGFNAHTAFLNQFTPTFVTSPLYHVDGQIKEEVYVYGSFLQSKMHQAGVNCIDCHDPHTQKLKRPGNATCLMCHSAETFSQTSHHGHQSGNPGSQCVDCHMPEQRFMGVDDRRDHSFKIPRPDLASALGTTNPCAACHSDKTNEWSASAIASWNGKPKSHSNNYQNFITLQQERAVALEDHLAIVRDLALPEIVRATALSLLPKTTQTISEQQVLEFIQSKQPLVRLAIAQVGHLIPTQQRVKAFSILLDDPLRSVRVAAANQLIAINLANNSHFEKAFTELLRANEMSRWRGEGNINQSIVYAKLGELDKTVVALQASIYIEPYFEPAYINLAELYRNTGQEQKQAPVLQQGLEALPKSALLWYSYGLYQVRSETKQTAVVSIKKAVDLEPTNVQYGYAYFLTLDALGQTQQAVKLMQEWLIRYQYHPQIIKLGLNFSQKINDRQSYKVFAHYLN